MQEEELRIGLRTGEKKLYVIKDIRRFLSGCEAEESMQLGKEFLYQPEWMHYSDDDERLLNLPFLSRSMTRSGRMVRPEAVSMARSLRTW